jgi:hypothetical protein
MKRRLPSTSVVNCYCTGGGCGEVDPVLPSAHARPEYHGSLAGNHLGALGEGARDSEGALARPPEPSAGDRLRGGFVQRGLATRLPGLGISRAPLAISRPTLSIGGTVKRSAEAAEGSTLGFRRAFALSAPFHSKRRRAFSTMENPSPYDGVAKNFVKELAIRDWLGKIRGAAGACSSRTLEKAMEGWGETPEFESQRNVIQLP